VTRKNPLAGKGIPSFDKFDNKQTAPQDTQSKESKNESTSDILDMFQTPKKIEKKQAVFWLELDVIEALDAWASKQEKKKGHKSGLVNELLKQTFNIRQDQ